MKALNLRFPFVLAALVAAPVAARAQGSNYYVAGESTAPYAELAAPVATLFTESDDGFTPVEFASVPDGANPPAAFQFKLFGRTVTRMFVSVNGAIAFNAVDSVTQQTFILPGNNVTLPSSVQPNGVVAAMWDDWVATARAPDGGSAVRWGVVGSAPNRTLVVDWARMQLYGATGATSPTYSFQLRLVERINQVEIRYGPTSNTAGGSILSASVGIENWTASTGMKLLDCTPTCGAAAWPPGRPGILVSPNQNAELAISARLLGNAQDGPRVGVTINNSGQAAATGVRYRVYASTDEVLDPAQDVLVYENAAPGLDLGITAETSTFNATLVIPGSGPVGALSGRYRLIAIADPDLAIVELSRTNNVAATVDSFLAGADLTVTAGAQGSAILGEEVVVNVTLANAGVRSVPATAVRFVLSGPLLDAPRVLTTTNPYAVPAEGTSAQPVTVAVPSDVLPGDYEIDVLVDPDGAVTETDENNNRLEQKLKLVIRGADIGVLSVAAGSRVGFRGGTVPVRVTLVNRGLARAADFRFSMYLSVNDVITLRDIKIFSSSVISLGPNTTRVFTEPARIPADAALGTYYVGIIVDAEGAVLETDRTNNVRRAADQLTISPAVADLAIASVASAQVAAAGESLRVTGLLTNVGAQAATGVPYGIYLSPNATLSSADLKVGEATVSLQPGEQLVIAADARVPASLTPGQYTVGIIVNPTRATLEADYENNVAVGTSLVDVKPSSLLVTTERLPDGVVAVPYEARLAASGAASPITWSLAGGALPAGLTLASSGLISGSPTSAGTSSVVVRAYAAGLEAFAALTLSVQAFAPSLGLVDERLPSARRGRTYASSVAAIGGVPPYTFSLAGGALPAGLSLASTGDVTGLPTELGSFTFSARAVDAIGHAAEGSVALDVLSDAGSVVFGSNRLPDFQSSRPDTQRIAVSGGQPPYIVSVLTGAPPPGLNVSVDEGGTVVSLSGTPSEPGSFPFTLSVSDARGDRDVAQFVVRVRGRAVTFATLTLPDAIPGRDYSFKFDTNARPPAAFSLAGGELPPGVSLGVDGTLSGTVAVDAPQALYAFAVRVSETTAGGSGLSAFSIDVPAPPRVSQEIDGGGCTTVGGSWFALLSLAGLIRRRRLASLGVLAFVALAPSIARANYVVDRAAAPFAECTTTTCGGVAIQTPAATDGSVLRPAAASQIPFPFKFWGQAVDAVNISPTGYLSFGPLSNVTANTKIPVANAPNNLIAVFWDDLRMSPDPIGSSVKVGTSGTAPNRVFLVEWRNMQMSSAVGVGRNSYSFQVRLYEGTNEISMHYGGTGATGSNPPAFTASIGVEGPTGTDGFELSDVNCSPGCTAASFPVNQVIRLKPAADLSIDRVVAPSLFFSGAPVQLRTVVRNRGGAAANAATLQYLLSEDTLIDSSDVVLGTTAPFTVADGTALSVSTQLTVPEGTEVGLYQLLVRADPTDALREVVEDNNEAVPTPVALAPEAQDFTVTRLLAASVADAGRTLAVTRTIRNAGNVAGNVAYSIVLSTNDVISSADLVLEVGDGPLGPGATLDGVSNVSIPGDVPAGRYWLGLIVRPVDGSAELDALNNERTLGPISIRSGTLAISTAALPPVLAGIPFAVQLEGAGGAGGYQWLAGGPLPTGVSLSPEGVLAGVVEVEGDYDLSVRLVSGSTVVTRSFVMQATSPSVPLTFAPGRLPIALLGVPYSAYLSAIGGRPPYAWALASGSLAPPGLALASDGAFEGVPLVDGRATVVVSVTDANGETTGGEVTIDVTGPDRPIIATTSLPSATVETAYETVLDVAGGIAPYRFAVIESRRLALGFEGECDVLGDCAFNRQLPPGLSLTEGGAIAGTPSRAGVYVVTIQAIDARETSSASASLLLAIEAGGDFSIVTARLPDAEVGTEYRAQLAASGGQGSATWYAVFPEGAALPSLLTFTPEGTIVGYPRAPGSAAFLAIARDGVGRLAIRPLGLRVVAAPTKPAATGCASASPGLLGLLLLVPLALRRRGGRKASLGGFVAALTLLGAGCIATPVSPCATECVDGSACDPLDGLCKCGGSGGAICGGSTTCDTATKSCVQAACSAGCEAPLVCGFDGACRCGSPNGPSCAAGETCTVDGRCARRDPCAGVACGRGTSCDPADGRCVCGPQARTCGATEVCVSGECSVSLCLGVTCTGGTTCDPSDGACKCGGAGGGVCANGEACDAVNARCQRVDRCASVSCGPGQACDPTDGACRCGGLGGPVCAADQACDPVAAQCRGGDRCRDVQCGPGSVCDPEDGVCRCGSLVCEASQTCAALETGRACVEACTPFGAACGAELGCRFDPVPAITYCAPIGVAANAAACTTDAPCASGLHCVFPENDTNGTCRPYCLTADACAQGEICAQFVPGNPLGFCVRRAE